jgi:hypothetical protein
VDDCIIANQHHRQNPKRNKKLLQAAPHFFLP